MRPTHPDSPVSMWASQYDCPGWEPKANERNTGSKYLGLRMQLAPHPSRWRLLLLSLTLKL